MQINHQSKYTFNKPSSKKTYSPLTKKIAIIKEKKSLSRNKNTSNYIDSVKNTKITDNSTNSQTVDFDIDFINKCVQILNI